MNFKERSIATLAGSGFTSEEIARKIGSSKSLVDHARIKPDVKALIDEIGERGPTSEETLRALLLSPNETVRLRAAKDLESVLASQGNRGSDDSTPAVTTFTLNFSGPKTVTCPCGCGHTFEVDAAKEAQERLAATPGGHPGHQHFAATTSQATGAGLQARDKLLAAD